LLTRLGPGLITGAADDDPGGIATHSQVGAQFGLGLIWMPVLAYPLMTAIQAICARIGRVTGEGLAANMAHVLPRWLVHVIVGLLLVANTVNIGANLAAMGAAAKLLLGWGEIGFAIAFAAASLLLQVFLPYHRYVHVLKWLTMSLFAYVAVVFTVAIDWGEVARAVFLPQLTLSRETLIAIVAVFGTTISPYMFFWQSAEEVEDEKLSDDGSLLDHPDKAPVELNRITWDTLLGMGFSTLISFFIVLTTAVTLNAQGITDIASSADAARALRPIAGEFAFLLFSLGIIGTGLLALPVLAGSAAYGVIALSFGFGLLMLFLPIDPIKALFWSAVLNGLIAVPLMIATMLVVSSRKHLGAFVAPVGLRIMGWLATAVMAGAALLMFIL
jgi:NRAMP (natural resistance-associated macrophage protein)-like metal ion transporter